MKHAQMPKNRRKNNDGSFYQLPNHFFISSIYVFGTGIFELRVFHKQFLYLYEVVIRSAHILPSSGPTCKFF